MPQVPPQTDTYNTALDIFDRTHPLRVDADENLKVTGTFTPFGTQDVNIISSVPISVIQSGSWTVIADQGTTPWTISGSVLNTPPANQSINITQIGGAALSEGQKLSAASIPVVIASDQSAIPVTGTITTSPNVNVHDGSGVSISSTGSSLNVDVTNIVPVTLTSTTITGNVTVVQPTGSNLHVDIDNFPAIQPVSGTITANQGTSPWIVSGTIVTSPNVNVHDGSGNTIASTGTSLNVDVTNTVPVTLTSTTITGNVTVVQSAGANLHVDVDNFPATQPISAVSLPLPTGASTSANQTTANTSLASIDSKTPALVGGRQPVDGSGVVQPITRVGATLNTSQISVGSTSTLIIAANANRKRLVLINMGTTNVFIGNIGVTIGTGQLLLGIAGYVIPLYFTGAVYGIVGTGTQTIAYLEEAV